MQQDVGHSKEGWDIKHLWNKWLGKEKQYFFPWYEDEGDSHDEENEVLYTSL